MHSILAWTDLLFDLCYPSLALQEIPKDFKNKVALVCSKVQTSEYKTYILGYIRYHELYEQ